MRRPPHRLVQRQGLPRPSPGWSSSGSRGSGEWPSRTPTSGTVRPTEAAERPGTQGDACPPGPGQAQERSTVSMRKPNLRGGGGQVEGAWMPQTHRSYRAVLAKLRPQPGAAEPLSTLPPWPPSSERSRALEGRQEPESRPRHCTARGGQARGTWGPTALPPPHLGSSHSPRQWSPASSSH